MDRDKDQITESSVHDLDSGSGERFSEQIDWNMSIQRNALSRIDRALR